MTRKKKYYLILIAIVIAGFIMRLLVCNELLNSDTAVTSPAKETDMYTYMILSKKVSNGTYEGELDYQPFYYVVFLPVVRFLLGKSIWGVLITQSLLGALTIFLTSQAAALIWGKRGSIIAALLITFSETLILYTPYHMIVTLQTFWISLITFLVILMLKKESLLICSFSGIATSFSILTRGNTWFFVPGIVAIALYIGFRKKQAKEQKLLKKLLPVIMYATFVILPQLPFALYNSKVKGKLTGPSSAATKVLLLGNTPEAPPGGRNPGFGPGPMEYPPTYGDWMSGKSGTPGSKLASWAFSQPLAFLELQLRKMLLFWDHEEIPNNIAFETQGEKSILFNVFGFIPISVIIILSLVGIIVSVGRLRYNFAKLTVCYFIVAYWLGTSAFYILSRFRAPVIPVLAIFAAGLFIQMKLLWKSGKKRELTYSFVAMLFFGMLCFSGYDTYRFFFEPSIMNLIRPDGVKVELSDGRTMYLDNGPITEGSWAPVLFTQNPVVTKKFSREPENGVVKLSLSLFWETPGRCTLEINGVKKEIETAKPGIHEHLIEVSDSSEFNFKVINQTANAGFLIDFQREYGRTKLNNKIIDGELVCRLYTDSE